VRLRSLGREIAFQALYQHDFGAGREGLFGFDWLEGEVPPDALLFATELIEGTLDCVAEIDDELKKTLEHWDLSRLSRVDRAILRLSVHEILHRPDIPARVAIDEGIELAKRFGGDQSYRFVNGVLDAVRKRNEERSPVDGENP
jgi:N utilization substance protein B